MIAKSMFSPLLFALIACSSSDGDSGSTDATSGQNDAVIEDASGDPDAAAADDDAADDDASPDAVADTAPDLPGHPLVGTWTGNPADCFNRTKKSPGITMTFSTTEVRFRQFFMSGTNVCQHEGRGSVQELTDASFKIVGYKTIDTNCSLGMFLQGDQTIAFEFLDAEQKRVFLDPDKEECFMLGKK